MDELEINVAKEGAYQELCAFLDAEPMREKFPWRNKTVKA